MPVLRHAVPLQGRGAEGALTGAHSLAPRILVVAPNWIGDTLLAQPLLVRLREKHPGARIDVLAPPWVAPVLRRMPEVAEVIEARSRHGELQLARALAPRPRRCGRAATTRPIVLPNTLEVGAGPVLRRHPAAHGYVGESRYGLLNRLHKARRAREPMALHYARLAERARHGAGAAAARAAACRIRPDATRDRAFGLSRGPTSCSAPAPSTAPPSAGPISRELAARLDVPVGAARLGGRRARPARGDRRHATWSARPASTRRST